MSYILDALKKSQQERQQQQGPSLQSIHSQPLPRSQPGRLGYAILGTVAVLAVAGAGWLYWQQQQSIPAVAAVEPVAQTTLPAPPPEPAATAQSAPTTSSEPLPLREFYQLPEPVKKAIPALTFSFHLYSDNPERRTIIINNQRVREGATISNGLVLDEITAEGVILRWQDQHRFAITVVENW